jgi:hypothetical protein
MIMALAVCVTLGAQAPPAGKGAQPSLSAFVGRPIVCSPLATPAEKRAAEEFRDLFRMATGSELKIVADSSGPAVLIGPDAVTARLGERVWKPGEEDLRITVRPDTIAIDGGRPRGTLYGVYEFFEEYAGVRFLTFDHTYLPPDAARRLLQLGTYIYRPKFAFRWSYYGETSRRPDFAARLRVNTVSDDPDLGGRTGYRLVNHNVAYLVPPSKYAATHPEYYALVNGQRPTGTDGGGPQLCLTNPDVLDIVTDAVLEEIHKHPEVRNINIAQMDNANYCTCPRCAELDQREGSHAGTMIAFVNAVAERVAKQHPNVLLGTFAYWYTRKPPKTLRVHPNVMVQLCSIECCDLHAIDDPSCSLNQEFCRDMAVWKTKCDKVFIWHYNTNFSCYMLPFPNLRSIGKSVAYFARNHGRGVFMQAAGNGFSTELSDLRNYVMARCLWKPGRDSWKEAMEFCRLHYAEAAGPIMAYLAEYHREVARAGLHPTCFSTESALRLDEPTTKRIWDRFAEAMRLAGSEAVRQRVEKASLCAYRAALSQATGKLSYQDGVCRPSASEYRSDLLDAYAALCAKYGATMESETVTTEAYVASLQALFAGLKAVRLENSIWRVTVLPGSNGKIVEMVHKPSGRNVIQPHRAFNRFRYEDWVREGEGPGARSIMAYDVDRTDPDRVSMSLRTPDGTRFERTVCLVGDAVRIEGSVTASAARPLDLWLHPEYDAASDKGDPEVVSIYVRAPGWVQANKGWKDARPLPGSESLITGAVSGGAFAYYNHRERFGIVQSFDPALMGRLGLFWSPSRLQVNLEMFPKKTSLAAGETTQYWYEVRHLAESPVGEAGYGVKP